jgi:predicted Ser/Thr protein kinase
MERLKELASEFKALKSLTTSRLFPQVETLFCDNIGFHITMEYIDGLTLANFMQTFGTKRVPFFALQQIVEQLL